MKYKKKIGIIGSGNISDYHIQSFKDSGFILEAIAGSYNSNSAKILCKKYNFNRYFKSPHELASKSSTFLDGLLICCTTKFISSYIKTAGTKIKILAEKPVSEEIENLRKLKKEFSNVRVAYNRRFYDSVKALKNKIFTRKKFIANIELPEIIFKGKNRYRRVFENSVHVFDLINYIFESPKMIEEKNNIKNKNFFKNKIFLTKHNNIVNLICNWNTSSNFKFEVFFEDEKYVLNPIEILSVYRGMKISEPTKETPIRQYLPKKINQFGLTKKKIKYKPGFKIQAENFFNFIANKKNDLANLDDAYRAMAIAKKIIDRKN